VAVRLAPLTAQGPPVSFYNLAVANSKSSLKFFALSMFMMQRCFLHWALPFRLDIVQLFVSVRPTYENFP
jgi:hypothetical protein